MKKWKTPDFRELPIECTENGNVVTDATDEIRVDQDGNYWVSFSSAGNKISTTLTPTPDGAYVPDVTKAPTP